MGRQLTTNWIEWLQSGDEALFFRIVSPAIPHALATAGRTGLSPEDAEDVVQECLVELVRDRTGKPGEVGIIPWLIRQARLRSLSVLRTTRRRRSLLARAAPPSSRADPADSVSIRDEVDRALGLLPPDEREVVLLRHLHDLDYDEIGKVLSTSPAACRVRVHRALSSIRKRLGVNAAAWIALLPLPSPRAGPALLHAALGTGRSLVPTATTVSATATTGVLLMGTKSWLALGLGFLIILVGATRFSLRQGVAVAPPPAAPPEVGPVPADLLAERERLLGENEDLERRLDVARSREGTPDARPVTPRHGSVEVIVRSQDGSPGSGVRIHVKGGASPLAGPFAPGEGRSLHITTGADGRAHSPPLEPGLYSLSMRFPGGYVTQAVDIGPGNPVEVLLASPRGPEVEGRLTRFEGGEVAGASMLLWNAELAFECRSSEDGGFAFCTVPAGSYRLRVTGSPGTVEAFVAFRDVTLPSADRPPLDIEVRVPNLHGTVVDEATGEPISGARVGVRSRSLGKWTVTDSDGRWSFVDLYPVETVELAIEKEAYRPFRMHQVEFTPGQAREIPGRLARR